MAVAGHDERIRYWFGQAAAPTYDEQREVVARWRREYAAGTRFNFVVDVDGTAVGAVELRRPDPAAADPGAGDPHTGDLSWWLFSGQRGHGWATRAVRVLADWALTEAGQGGLGLARVEARVEPGNESSLRVATWSGLRREGVRGCSPAPGTAPRPARVVLRAARDDPPVSEPRGVPGAAQLLPAPQAGDQPAAGARRGRPGAAVPAHLQAGLGPARRRRRGGRVAAARRRPRGRGGARAAPVPRAAAAHRLAAAVGRVGRRALPGLRRREPRPAGIARRLVRQAREIRDAEFCTAEQVAERCADFTARRVEAALAQPRRRSADVRRERPAPTT